MENHAMDDRHSWSNLKIAALVLVCVNFIIYIASYIS